MAKRLNWGILATGWIADLFVKDLQLTGKKVVAVGSRSQQGADRFAAQFGIPKAHGSYEALVADPNVDIIYVATPHPMHAANAVMALEGGKHILVEKAFTINTGQARKIVDLAKSKNLQKFTTSFRLLQFQDLLPHTMLLKFLFKIRCHSFKTTYC